MKIDVYTATGTKKGTVDLPSSLFEAPINEGLMHQAVVRQQSNRRHAIAHAKSRGEVRGSTRKLFAQKGTGRARRGSVRSPLLRGGGKAFGPSSDANFTKDMPRSMRRAALKSCLSLQAKNNCILGLESYPEEIQTKKFMDMLAKMPVEIGRKILFVLPDSHLQMQLSARNIPNVKTILAGYLNPQDVLNAHHIIFMVDALKKAEEVFGARSKEQAESSPKTAVKETSSKTT
ncbi:50S ribosomal protein L4 [Candidatus Peregrinibacteria bacterium CG_4_9_14_3_um_filter_49_12]|nr:MAG: 50S ribosomal protein L4 [Candidatus Peregrinibacteria bacterium CG_4_9_14_3_um_filter_49_12]